MADIKARLSSARTKLFRRHSGLSSNSTSNTSPTSPKIRSPFGSRSPENLRHKSSTSSLKSRCSRLTPRTPQSGTVPSPLALPQDKGGGEQQPYQVQLNSTSTEALTRSSEPNILTPRANRHDISQGERKSPNNTTTSRGPLDEEEEDAAPAPAPTTISPEPPAIHFPPRPPDRVPEFPGSLMDSSDISNTNTSAASDYIRSERKDSIVPPLPDFTSRPRVQTVARMSRRKIWIKRPGASATTVQSTDEDLVDDIRDMVLRKYGNSLGRCFDPPDVTIRITPRERGHSAAERTLNPEEPIHSILDSYYPGGQTVEEALIIDVPQKRTPRPSPRAFNNYAVATAPVQPYENHQQPPESGNDYFPPMAANSSMPSTAHEHRHSHSHSHSLSLSQSQSYHPHSISIVETGQLPPLPSPRERKGHHRPRPTRQQTSSPTIMASQGPAPNGAPSHRGSRSEWSGDVNPNKHPSVRTPNINSSLPTPPPSDIPASVIKSGSTPPIIERVASPRPNKGSKHKKQASVTNGDSRRASSQDERRKGSYPHNHLHLNLFESSVPPINVLIVEDNIINLRLLEMFTKRLKVRWQTAMNGRDAVTKWRTGGFHLVLMDIQLPIMSGLEATKEIRRLERVNGIGVFAKSEAEETAPPLKEGDDQKAEDSTEDDQLLGGGLFKSPVIIVALTASSLQSDRHEALAAGCNDFLTKPVHFNWLERKVMEWGCMQALIDFDGWRKWKDIAAEEEKQKQKNMDPEAKAKAERKETKRADLLAKMGQKKPSK